MSLARAHQPADGMLHPAMVGGVVLLLLNDHVLKWSYPGVVTGKLSDVAGLLFFPLLLQAVVELTQSALGAWRGPDRRVLLGAALATAIVFAWVKTSGAGGDAYRVVLGGLQWLPRCVLAALRGDAMPGLARVRHVVDPTDLWALWAIPVGVWAGWRRSGQSVASSALELHPRGESQSR